MTTLFYRISPKYSTYRDITSRSSIHAVKDVLSEGNAHVRERDDERNAISSYAFSYETNLRRLPLHKVLLRWCVTTLFVLKITHLTISIDPTLKTLEGKRVFGKRMCPSPIS